MAATAELELNDREKAIARGETPEPVAPEPVAEVIENTEQPGTDAVPEKDGGGTEAARSDQPTWLTDEHKELAASYGIADEDLKDFATAAEFARATRLIDRQYASSGAAALKRMADGGKQPQQQSEQQPEQQPQKTAAKSPKFSRVDLEKMRAAGYDEETLSYLGGLNQLAEHAERVEQEREKERAEIQAIRQHFETYQQRAAQEQHQREVDQFHAALDRIDSARFGRAFSDNGQVLPLSRKDHEQRAKAFHEYRIIAAGIMANAQQSGIQPPPFNPEHLVRRAINSAFADDIRAEERKKVQNDIAEQSKRRRPVATAKAPNGKFVATKQEPQTIGEMAQQIGNLPDIKAFFDNAKQNNGAAV